MSLQLLACRMCGRNVLARGLCKTHYMKSRRHAHTGKINQGVKKRLLSKITILPSGCWEFTGNRKGGKFDYGLIFVDGKNIRAHRVSYQIYKGPIPEGMDILHKCDFPPCVNPDHLLVGTRADNNKDAVSKGRNARGERVGGKLTNSDVIAIRNSPDPQGHLAERFGVSQALISGIKNRKRWAHI